VPAHPGEPVELVLPRHPTRTQWGSVATNQSTYYQTFQQRYTDNVMTALATAAEAAARSGIPLDELLAQVLAASPESGASPDEEASPDAVPSA
ncbi:hypothetical protein KDL01_41685, partial [Actinospica durhamensis]